MNTEEMTASRGRAPMAILKAGLALCLALVLFLAFSQRAQAADCTTPEACYNAAAWQKAVADDYSNKAAWFRATSRQNFIDAKLWGDKATFAFYGGNGTAATWYKAIADDYSRKSVADAKAAENYANQAAFIRTAAAGNVRRAMSLTAFFYRGPEDSVVAGGPDPISVVGNVPCKNPKNREWSGGGVHVYAYVKNFCWRDPQEVTKVDLEFESDVTGVADAQISEDGCHEERWFYAWNINYDHSGRKVLITCRFDAKPAGVIPITVATMTCRVALYFHSNGSYAYTKPDKMRCNTDLF